MMMYSRSYNNNLNNQDTQKNESKLSCAKTPSLSIPKDTKIISMNNYCVIDGVKQEDQKQVIISQASVINRIKAIKNKKPIIFDECYDEKCVKDVGIYNLLRNYAKIVFNEDDLEHDYLSKDQKAFLLNYPGSVICQMLGYIDNVISTRSLTEQIMSERKLQVAGQKILDELPKSLQSAVLSKDSNIANIGYVLNRKSGIIKGIIEKNPVFATLLEEFDAVASNLKNENKLEILVNIETSKPENEGRPVVIIYDAGLRKDKRENY